MGDTKPFQVIFIGTCLALIIIGVLVFSFGGAKPDPSKNLGPEVVIWGTEDEKQMEDLIKAAKDGGALLSARYEQKDKNTFNQDLLEGLASGEGPDVILVSTEDVLTYQDKITIIPFESYSERDFRDTFIEQGELFKTGAGFLALPFSLDPLVMYWNRDLFTIHNLTTPPSRWDQVVSLVPTMRDVSEDLTVFEAVIGMGDYRNVVNAKSILSALMLQSGTPITTLEYRAREERLLLSSNLIAFSEGSTLVIPSVSAVNFYTQFAMPLSKQYTWNRSLQDSLNMFVANDLAMYLGFGSEVKLIRSKNPNLNFDMAVLPQSDASPTPVTYGKMQGLAILSASTNKAGALQTIGILTGADFIDSYAKATGLPPVRRDLLSKVPGDVYSAVLYKSALYSRGFLDPNVGKTNTIFQSLVETVLSGRYGTTEALQNAENQFRLLIDDFNRKQK